MTNTWKKSGNECEGNGAKAVRVGGDLPPAGRLVRPCGRQFLVQIPVAPSALSLSWPSISDADAVARRQCARATFLRRLAEKRVGLLQQQAAAVAGAAVGGDAAPVGHAGQRLDGGPHQTMAGLALEVGDQAKAAVVLEFVGW